MEFLTVGQYDQSKRTPSSQRYVECASFTLDTEDAHEGNGTGLQNFINWHASKLLLATSPYAAEPLMVGESRLNSANVRFRNLALSRSRNWTVTANDRYVDTDPVSGLAATVRNRRNVVESRSRATS